MAYNVNDRVRVKLIPPFSPPIYRSIRTIQGVGVRRGRKKRWNHTVVKPSLFSSRPMSVSTERDGLKSRGHVR